VANTTGNLGGPEPGPSGEPAADYGYSGGSGYGPGNGDPDDGDGYRYEPPGYATPPSPDPGPDPEVPVPPVVAGTPALRGFPGGPGLAPAAAPADAASAAAAATRETRGPGSLSVWQRAQQAWRDAGVEWQRTAADWEPAEAEWERGQGERSGQDRGAGGQAAWSGDAARGKLLRRLSAKSPANTPGRAIRLKGRAVKSSAVKGGVASSSVVTSPPGPWHVRRRVWQAALAVIVILVLVVVGFLVFDGTGGASAGSARKAAVAQYPPARLAGADFGTDPGQRARGIFQSVSSVAAAGSTIVAVGSITGQWIPRAQFLVSADGGHNWRLAPVRGPGGSVPSPADLPLLVAGGAARAGGRGGWLAVGDGAAWTSPDGQAWTLAPGTGIAPQRAADQVLALAATGRGFLAVGENVPGGDQAKATPVAWTSADGLNWRRLPATSLHLAVPARGRLLRLTQVTAHGGDVIVMGETATVHGQGKHRVTSLSDGVWRSRNGGRSWAAAHLPAGHGTAGQIAGLAVAGHRFVAIRPGRTGKTGRDAVAYASRGGGSWTRVATITAAKKDHLKITAVGGSDQGAVVSGQLAGGARVAWVSSDGRAWRRVAGLGSSAQTLAGVTVTAGRTVVAAGATARAADSRQPYLVLAGRQASAVNFAAIAGAVGPALRVSGIAVAGRTRVAVGSANGYPAIWSAPGVGRWRRISSAALIRPGLGTLASVVHGRPGWLAVGAVTAGPSSRPVVVASAGQAGWQAADGEPAFRGAGITLSQAAAGRSGNVIVGRQVIPARTVTKTTIVHRHKHVIKHVIPSRIVAAAWWSAGLSGWARETGAGAADLDGPGARQMDAVTAAGSGYVAVGSLRRAPAVWTSANGRQWALTTLPPPAGARGGALQQVAAQGRVIVATGNETTAAGTAAFAAYSTDGGRSWQQTLLSAHGGLAAVTALAAAGGGFEAVGTVGRPGNQRVIVWSSRDGVGWHAREPAGTGLSGRGSQAITALTSSGSLLTGVGYLATPAAEQPTLWRAATARPSASAKH
jgi:hypothetical protein